jgi:hypothetical protein
MVIGLRNKTCRTIVDVSPSSARDIVSMDSIDLSVTNAILAPPPGPQPRRKMLIWSGHTIGTQAVVEFTCRRETLQELMKTVA